MLSTLIKLSPSDIANKNSQKRNAGPNLRFHLPPPQGFSLFFSGEQKEKEKLSPACLPVVFLGGGKRCVIQHKAHFLR